MSLWRWAASTKRLKHYAKSYDYSLTIAKPGG